MALGVDHCFGAVGLHRVVQRGAGHVAGGDVGDRTPRVGVHDLGDVAAADATQRGDLARQAVPLLLATRRGEGCVLADGEGHAQWVAGVYSTSALVAAAESLGDATDRPLRALLGRLSTRALAAPGRVGDDVDTWDQVSEWNDYFIDGEDADESSADDEPEERSANE